MQLVRQEVAVAEAPKQQHVDRSTIMRIRTIAKVGALPALAASKPGAHAREREYELELADAEVARLSEAVKQMAVKLTLAGGKAAGPMWPGSAPRRRGQQGRPVACSWRAGR